MNNVCANCQNNGTFIHELNIQYCSIIYPTGLRDERKLPCPKGVSCSINCVLPAGKSVINNFKMFFCFHWIVAPALRTIWEEKDFKATPLVRTGFKAS